MATRSSAARGAQDVDGRAYTVVKVYYDPDDLARKLSGVGFDPRPQRVDNSVFTLTGTKRQVTNREAEEARESR